MDDLISRAGAIKAICEDGRRGERMNREEKMKIVINNYFKTECSVNTSIREAFEKGFRIGASKVQKKHGKWIERESGTEDKENGFETVIVCSCCDFPATTFYSEDCESRTQIRTDYCPNCGADMRGDGGDGRG